MKYSHQKKQSSFSSPSLLISKINLLFVPLIFSAIQETLEELLHGAQGREGGSLGLGDSGRKWGYDLIMDSMELLILVKDGRCNISILHCKSCEVCQAIPGISRFGVE